MVKQARDIEGAAMFAEQPVEIDTVGRERDVGGGPLARRDGDLAAHTAAGEACVQFAQPKLRARFEPAVDRESSRPAFGGAGIGGRAARRPGKSHDQPAECGAFDRNFAGTGRPARIRLRIQPAGIAEARAGRLDPQMKRQLGRILDAAGAEFEFA